MPPNANADPLPPAELLFVPPNGDGAGAELWLAAAAANVNDCAGGWLLAALPNTAFAGFGAAKLNAPPLFPLLAGLPNVGAALLDMLPNAGVALMPPNGEPVVDCCVVAVWPNPNTFEAPWLAGVAAFAADENRLLAAGAEPNGGGAAFWARVWLPKAALVLVEKLNGEPPNAGAPVAFDADVDIALLWLDWLMPNGLATPVDGWAEGEPNGGGFGAAVPVFGAVKLNADDCWPNAGGPAAAGFVSGAPPKANGLADWAAGLLAPAPNGELAAGAELKGREIINTIKI